MPPVSAGGVRRPTATGIGRRGAGLGSSAPKREKWRILETMSAPRGQQNSSAGVPKALAFYLPQYHPIPENDEWWGKGFTEWANVTKARPRFPGHYQPHVPGELGYYDLRIPEVREAQAELAREHGISGFVYYHYWFNGKRLLERPFEEVLASGSPDFPFALCWANEEWTRNWDARSGSLLMPQEFSDEDDLAHIRHLATAFNDERYITIDGRPLMLVYRPLKLPNPQRTFQIWRDEAKKLGIPDLYLCYVESHGPPPGGPAAFGMDASVGFMPVTGDEVFTPAEGARGNHLIDYRSSLEKEMARPRPTDYLRFPSVMVSWDNTARRPSGATIFDGATPDVYQEWLQRTVDGMADIPEEENYLFILAWNEWAEGNHLEPDQKFGRAWLEATRAVLLGDDVPDGSTEGAAIAAIDEDVYPNASAMALAVGLINDLLSDRSSAIAEIRAGKSPIVHMLADMHTAPQGLHVDRGRSGWRADQAGSGRSVDLAAATDVTGALDEISSTEPVGAVLLLDALADLANPQALLTTLSRWSLAHGSPMLVVSAPNVAHFDVALRLLCGQWGPTASGLLGTSHLRFFTERTLANLLERTGWEIVARDDIAAIRSDQYDARLADALPVEMMGALRVLSQAEHPNAAIKHFVWALRPVATDRSPEDYLEAVRLTPDEHAEAPIGDPTAVASYLSSIGILASEASRRASEGAYAYAEGSGPIGQFLGYYKRVALRTAYKTQRRGAIFRRVYRWFR
jgi:hypothetical protein